MPGNFSCSELWSEQQPTGLCRAWPAPSLPAGAMAGEPSRGAWGHVHGKHGASPCCHPGNTIRAEPPIRQQYLRVWGSRTSCGTQELAEEPRAMPPSIPRRGILRGRHGHFGAGHHLSLSGRDMGLECISCAGAGKQEGAHGSPPRAGWAACGRASGGAAGAVVASLVREDLLPSGGSRAAKRSSQPFQPLGSRPQGCPTPWGAALAAPGSSLLPLGLPDPFPPPRAPRAPCVPLPPSAGTPLAAPALPAGCS